MTKQEMIDRIRELDAYYEEVPLEEKTTFEIEYLLDFIESDPEVEKNNID